MYLYLAECSAAGGSEISCCITASLLVNINDRVPPLINDTFLIERTPIYGSSRGYVSDKYRTVTKL